MTGRGIFKIIDPIIEIEKQKKIPQSCPENIGIAKIPLRIPESHIFFNL